MLLREVLVTRRALQGSPVHRLDELADLPDEAMAQIKPVLNPEYEILLRDDAVWWRHRETAIERELFATVPENVVAFNLFDGRHSLEHIGRQLAQEMGWEEAHAYAHARDLFLTLFATLVFVPANPLSTGDEQGAP